MTGLVSPLFVGRRDELERLTDQLRAAVDGTPVVAIIGGEAGVGKSRLVGELVDRATDELGMRVLLGNCVQLGSQGLPFAPLVDALRLLSRSMPREEFDRLLGPARRPLLRLLPNLAPAEAHGADEPDVQGPQLLELVLGLVERLAAAAPVLIVIEDLHWADQSTLELVAYFVRALRGSPVAVVGTFRSDELHRSHPLRALLTSWERSRTVQRIELVRFDRDEVASQLSAILGREPQPALLDTVFQRSEGNAFLVEELLGVVTAGGDPTGLPPSLRDVLLARVDGLGPQAQRLLRTAAVGGRWVPEQLLLAVSGLDEAEAFAALHEAVENHLLVVDGTGRGYSFRHALARDAVYDDMLPGERSRLHAAYGEVLSTHPEFAGDDRGALVADLAHHWYAALDLPRALAASVEAAQGASQRYAPAEALQHLERALQLWPRVADAEANVGMDQVEVLRLAAHAAYASGAVDRARALLDQALAEVGEAGDVMRRAILLERKAQTVGTSLAIALLKEALDCLPAEEVTVAHAMALASLATAYMRINEAEAAVTTAERAVAAARVSGAEQQEADAQITLGFVMASQGDYDAGLAAGRVGIDRALDGGHTATALRGYINLTDVLEALGRGDEALDVASEGIGLAQRVGLARSIGTFLTGNLAESLVRLGRWAEADAVIATTLAAEPEGVFAATVLEIGGQLAAMSGRYDQASECVMRARRFLGENTEAQFDTPFAYTLAEVARVQGDLAGALELLRDSVRDSALLAYTARYTWPLVWLGLRIQADLAIRARDRSSPVGPLDPVFEDALEHLPVANPPATAFRLMALAERSRYAGGQDVQPWHPAILAWREVGRPYELAYCLLRLAEVHALAGAPDPAGRALAEAHTLATQLGAAPLVAEAEQLARQARLRLESVAAPLSPVDDAGADEVARYGLTHREREVLAMLAAGRSNPEIAKALFISPKTASVHVSNILAKLGVGGRVEAATLAHRLGLADEPANAETA
jgi:ATP/maltotriose-dependent transcriptional regulator MalT